MPPGRNNCQYTTSAGIVRYMTSKERNPYRFIETPVSQLKSGSGGLMQGFPAVKPQGRQNAPRGEGFRGFVDFLKRTVKELF